MTEEDDKLVTLKFAIDMRKATRAATIEECAKVAEDFYEAKGGPNGELAGHRVTSAPVSAKAIRSLKNTSSVDNREG